MRYLLTGGAGFIGHHVADHLLNRGDEVVILGWRATQLFEPLLERTINWSLQHPEWLL